ncbi:MAG: DUF4397 domain-containing protein [Chitinophagaceae bacterium]
MKCSVLLMAVLLLCSTSCKKADNNFNARISFLNGAIGAADFTIKFNDDIAIGKIPFDTLKLYSSVPSGTFKIGFYQGVALSPDFSFTTNIESGVDYTCFTFDSVRKYTVFFQKDALPAKVSAGRCAIRFFSLIPNTTGLRLVNDTGKTILSGKTFASYPNTFEEVDTTSRLIKMFRDTTVVAVDSIFKPLVSGKIYTVFLTGSIGGIGTEKPKLIFWNHN